MPKQGAAPKAKAKAVPKQGAGPKAPPQPKAKGKAKAAPPGPPQPQDDDESSDEEEEDNPNPQICKCVDLLLEELNLLGNEGEVVERERIGTIPSFLYMRGGSGQISIRK